MLRLAIRLHRLHDAIDGGLTVATRRKRTDGLLERRTRAVNILGIDAPGAPSRLVSRREVFAGAAALLGAGLLCTPALDAQMLNPQVPPTDLTLLNYFLTLENL